MQQDDSQQDASQRDDNSPSPFEIERKRAPFSFDTTALRQRHTSSTSESTTTASSSTAHPSTSGSVAAAATRDDNAPSTARDVAGKDDGGGVYDCNICFDTATNPVITLCGHLYCWPCLHQWLEQQSQNPLCPVCKAGCGKDKVIPVYGRGKEAKDPRFDTNIPNRPAGQRPAPLRDPNAPAQNTIFNTPFNARPFNSNFTVSAGFGLFPFGIQFTFPGGAMAGNNASTPQQAFLSRLFLMIGSLILIAILLY
ncbi:hypothetical protein BC937DRAFT_89244 [Endogone sp. FLAS-F59071]|nr:hypothetical protein BC937DRAFT_89244 [Endogone sp. FLAS-F59071]|eukprot:RUS22428.1 hypothetical protein BC937DRAFT_89244 [Endogone sp. FLAS-F59071]